MIKKLPHWAVTDLKPAIYDTESFTAIEQTANLYAKIEEVIDDYNAFVDSTNTLIETFVNNSNANFETFQVAINQNITEFVTLVETKLTAQDTQIANTISYIRDNLTTYIINNVRGVLEDLIEAGALDQTILDIFDSFNASLQTLNSNVGNVSTLNLDIFEAHEDHDFCCTVDAINIVDNKINSEITARETLAEVVETIESNVESIDLTNYIAKDNTTEYTPTSDYNPSTKKYVDDKVSTVDTSNFLAKDNTTAFTPDADYEPATKKYVDDNVSNVSVDLSNYLGKDNTTEFTPDADYEPATKKYVDDIMPEYFYLGNYNFSTGNSGYAPVNNMVEPFKKYLAKIDELGYIIPFMFFNKGHLATGKITDTTATTHMSVGYVNIGEYYSEINYRKLHIKLTRTSGVITGVSISTSDLLSIPVLTYYASKTTVLLKDNTTAFTPTADYHPATKKYVDDSVTGYNLGATDLSSTITLGTDVTNSTDTSTKIKKYGPNLMVNLQMNKTNYSSGDVTLFSMPFTDGSVYAFLPCVIRNTDVTPVAFTTGYIRFMTASGTLTAVLMASSGTIPATFEVLSSGSLVF